MAMARCGNHAPESGANRVRRQLNLRWGDGALADAVAEPGWLRGSVRAARERSYAVPFLKQNLIACINDALLSCKKVLGGLEA